MENLNREKTSWVRPRLKKIFKNQDSYINPAPGLIWVNGVWIMQVLIFGWKRNTFPVHIYISYIADVSTSRV